MPPSPFEREHRYIDGLITNAGRARSKAKEGDVPKVFRRGRPNRTADLTRSQLLDVLFGRDFMTQIAARNNVSPDTVRRYRRMYEETGRIYDEQVFGKPREDSAGA
jgi:hypothetical protein